MLKTGVVEGAGTSKFGPWIKLSGVEGYLNPSKFAKPDFSVATKGSTIEVDVDGKYVKSLKLIGAGAPPENQGGSQSHGSSAPSNKDEQIARSTAVKSVLGSPLLADALKNKDISEMIADAKAIVEEMTRYILTGSFVEKAD